MGKMSELDLIIQNIKNIMMYIMIALIVITLAFLVHGKELNSVETRLKKQEQYMHEVKADIDNLKEVHLKQGEWVIKIEEAVRIIRELNIITKEQDLENKRERRIIINKNKFYLAIRTDLEKRSRRA